MTLADDYDRIQAGLRQIRHRIHQLPDDVRLELLEQLGAIDRLRKTDLKLFLRKNYYVKQDDIINSVLDRVRTKNGKKIHAVLGGNRSGKSVSGALSVLTALETIPGLRVWAATFSDLTIKNQQRLVWDYVNKDAIDYGFYTPSNGFKQRTVTFKNGSILYFKTYEQTAAAFQGDSLDLIWLDEECDWPIFQECLARLTDRQGCLLFTFTSLQGFTRLVDFLYSDSSLIALSTLTLLDNPYISQQSKDEFLAVCDRDEIDSRVYGIVQVKQGLVYKEFSRDIHLISDFDYVRKWKNNRDRYKLIEAIDPHVRTPHHWIRALHDTEEDCLYIVDELQAPQESQAIHEFCALIRAKRGGIAPDYCEIDTASMAPTVIRSAGDDDCDQSENIRQEFYRCGIVTILCLKDNAIGINAVKYRLLQVRDDNGKLKKDPSLYVFRSLSGIQKEFVRYSWGVQSDKVTANKGEINTVKKVDDHYMDLIKYICLRLIVQKTGKSVGQLDCIRDIYRVT